MNANPPLPIRDHNFLRLWIGQVLNQGGQRIYEISIVWWVLQSFGDQAGGTKVGLLLVTTAMPALLFFRPIGRLVDRLPRRGILLGSDGIAASLLGAVALLLAASYFSLPLAYVFAFAFATVQAVVNPTLNRALPEVVAESDLQEAVSFQASTQAMASFAGAALGAILIERLGIGGVALFAATLYGVSFAINASIRFRPQAAGAAAAPPEEVRARPVLQNHPRIKRMLIAFTCINFFSVPTLVVLPLYVDRVLGGSATLLGGLEACLWLGLVGGALLSPKLPKGGDIARVGFLTMTVFGIALTIPGLVLSPWIAGISLASAGLALGVNNARFIGHFQSEIPDEEKGRFFATLQALVGAAFPLGYFAFGSLGDLLAPHTLWVAQGCGIGAVALYFGWLARTRESGVDGAPERLRTAPPRVAGSNIDEHLV